MRICFIGAGALGGYMSAKLAMSGADVVVVETGARRQAILNQGGLTVIEPRKKPYLASLSVLQAAAVGDCDLVVIAVKAMAIADVAPLVPPMCHEGTKVLVVQNGIPWWYFQKHGGAQEGMQIASLDPDRVIQDNIDSDRLLACVAYPALDCPDHASVRLVSDGKFPLGELDGSTTERVQEVRDQFESAGLRSRILDDVRSEIWLKALGSVSLNPISALTGATMAEICQDPRTLAIARAAMEEAAGVCAALGITLRRTIEERIAGAAGVGDHKTSMLQDVEAGRPMEVDALVGAVSELGQVMGVQTPTIDMLHALVRLLDNRSLSAT